MERDSFYEKVKIKDLGTEVNPTPDLEINEGIKRLPLPPYMLYLS